MATTQTTNSPQAEDAPQTLTVTYGGDSVTTDLSKLGSSFFIEIAQFICKNENSVNPQRDRYLDDLLISAKLRPGESEARELLQRQMLIAALRTMDRAIASQIFNGRCAAELRDFAMEEIDRAGAMFKILEATDYPVNLSEFIECVGKSARSFIGDWDATIDATIDAYLSDPWRKSNA
jgi:hypothetical protein